MVKFSSEVRIRGVNAFAREMGVAPAHVSMVLRGKRQSKRIMDAAIARGFVPLRRRRRK